jgi:hypothetical protein
VDESHLRVVVLSPQPSPTDYREAMALAEEAAASRLELPMLIAWYDRERDFESPQHSSECHLDSAVPGYVDYAHSHGATLKVDIEAGRFVFYFLDAAL